MTEGEREQLQLLLSAWQSAPPEPRPLEEIERYLVLGYQAYEIPTAVIPQSDYLVDDEVREEDIAKLYTITDPKALARAFDGWDLDMWKGDTDASERAVRLEEDRRFLFEELDLIGFRLLHLEQSRGERVSVLLEAQDGFATGFRVYNSAGRLASDLTARVGPVCFPPFVEVGNIDDRDFRLYLIEAGRQGLI